MEFFTVRKIKKLKNIKPDKDWVSLTKEEILGETKGVRFEQANQMINWLFLPVKNHVLAARVVVVASVLLVTAVLGSYYYLSNIASNVAIELQSSLSNIMATLSRDRDLNDSLQELQLTLAKIDSSLDSLKQTRNKEALVTTEVVRATAANSKNVLQGIKKNVSSKKTLASITEIENGFEKIEEKSAGIQREMISAYLEDLKGRSLNQEDEERLEKAEEYFKQGKDSEALILIMKIGQNNN